ncbi:hypothetical protein NECAME_13323 [Necator americanus]|uniref:Uncharacterized protein n=1 Tax=Necator americanus TaxID=51031 RepID=W2SWM3_NECAM|nr:hypothetical protein NECAME_13323 [Necator americanus]ETN73903.1 hypothetical protein NECAME_13323 [Necator americanus]
MCSVGCIHEGKHYKVGDQWPGYDTIFLSPGRYTIWNLPQLQKKSVGLACRETSDGATLDVFDISQLNEHTQGLTYDQPRGK